MHKIAFIKDAAILTGATLITRCVGIIFRVNMAQKLGSAGIGLLGLVMTVYALCVTVCTSGIYLFIMRSVTDFLTQNQGEKALFALKTALKICLIFTIFVGILLYILSPFIADNFLYEPQAALSLRVLSLSLPFLAISACLRGYFFARKHPIYTAAEQLLEQLIEISVFYILIDKMLPHGVAYGCCAVVIGSTVGEIISFLFSHILYRLDIKKLKLKPEKYKGFLKNFLSIAFPVTGSSCLRSGLSTAENLLIPRGLTAIGGSRESSLAAFGEITGMAMPTLMFPSVFLYCFSTLIIPEMSSAKIRHHYNAINHMTKKVLKATIIFSLLIMLMFFFFSDNIGNLLFPGENTGFYIRLLAPLVPLLYLDFVVDGMLKGLNEQLHYLIYNIIDSIIRLILTLVLVPLFGITGVIIMLYVSAILNSSLSTARLLKVSRKHPDIA